MSPKPARERPAILEDVTRHLGRYELLRLIGRGGMAEVWLARHRGAGGIEKRVVIKRILREKANDPRFLSLFVTEAQISMALAHKNIVPTFDFGRVGDELFLVMEYVAGTNLAIAMQQAQALNKPPSVALICHIAFEACQALEYAHGYIDHHGNAQHIAHRDVTPPNLLLSTVGEIKLGDFGLAMATAGSREAEGSTRGTPRYMSPEQAVGGVVGPRSDIFSLGLILRDCLLFQILRTGSQKQQLAQAELPVPKTPARIPEDMRNICDRATQFAPEDRYPTAKAMSEDLDRALLHARMADSDDRRPMPEQLSDWLASVVDASMVEVSTTEPKVGGVTITYLDDGADEILAGPGDATMRSMAATYIGNSKQGSRAETERLPDENNETERLDDENRENKARPVHWRRLSIAALLLAPLTTALLLKSWSKEPQNTMRRESSRSTHAEHPTPSSTTARDAQPSARRAQRAFDAALAREQTKPPFAQTTIDAGNPHPHSRVMSNRKTSYSKEKRIGGSTVTPSTGTLRISSTPWATVTVQGRAETCTETPCQLRLPSGSYQLVLRNPIARLEQRITATVVREQATKIHAVLQAPLP